MLAAAVVIVVLLLLLAAAIDRRDRRRGHTTRDPHLVAAERRDLHADLSATQHRGIHTPIGDLCRDRQRGR